MITLITVSILLLGFSNFATPQINTAYVPVLCTSIANRNDAFCETQNPDMGSQCCAQVIHQTRTSTSVPYTNTTNYQCLPLEFAQQVGTVSIQTNLTQITYTCVNTARQATQICSDASSSSCSNSSLCCATRTARVANSQSKSFQNGCVAKPSGIDVSNPFYWTVITSSTFIPNITYTRQCIPGSDSMASRIQIYLMSCLLWIIILVSII
ncbi:UNKNOWN [Stylonychia lemnae]|uniref:Uncharacterized protein n=1 Tax=Stylonychia lemnae TaxID=5949 RepID=A0A077ZZ73_STYLE|nr:UNKNOWN [Stylonychia lemnae]|eukprot:CDW75251.1 UNKNOWN [Stylonychia lemnae]